VRSARTTSIAKRSRGAPPGAVDPAGAGAGGWASRRGGVDADRSVARCGARVDTAFSQRPHAGSGTATTAASLKKATAPLRGRSGETASDRRANRVGGSSLAPSARSLRARGYAPRSERGLALHPARARQLRAKPTETVNCDDTRSFWGTPRCLCLVLPTQRRGLDVSRAEMSRSRVADPPLRAAQASSPRRTAVVLLDDDPRPLASVASTHTAVELRRGVTPPVTDIYPHGEAPATTTHE